MHQKQGKETYNTPFEKQPQPLYAPKQRKIHLQHTSQEATKTFIWTKSEGENTYNSPLEA